MTGAEPGWTLDTAIPAEPVHTFSPHLRSHSVFTPGPRLDCGNPANIGGCQTRAADAAAHAVHRVVAPGQAPQRPPCPGSAPAWSVPATATPARFFSTVESREATRVALLSAHFEGNLGDEYETTPLLQRLSDWGAEVDAYSDPWLDPTDQSIAHTRTRELKFVNTFYTSDQWVTDSESLLSSDPPTLPGGLYDILIIAPGPVLPPLRLSSILKLAESTETPLAMVGVSMPGGEYSFERDRYRHGYDPLRLVILREPVSFAIAAPELGFNNLSTTERDPITDVADGHVRVMMSGDISWSFAPRDSELRAWQGTYSKEFSARFGDTEPWYVLFLRYPDHLHKGTNSTHLVAKDIDGSTMVVPIARSILANDDQSARGDAETHEEMQSRFKLAPIN